MSNKNSKLWTVGTLKSRGWNNRLIKDLLPKGRYVHMGGRSVPAWDGELVLRAEASPEFQKIAGDIRARMEASQLLTPEEALARTAALLTTAWEAAEHPDTLPAKLAQKYHEALLSMLPGYTWADRLKPGQAAGRVTNFLTLGTPKAPDDPGPILKNFLSAGSWLGRHTEDDDIADRVRERYVSVLYAVSERSLASFAEAQPKANAEGLLAMEDFPLTELLTRSLGYIYSVVYVPIAIRSSLQFLAELNPQDEYPEARAMKRHFVLHVGGTNTGKTYAGFQRLKKAATGVYLAPLRLLALEAQELLLDAGVACSLTTGEEEDREEGDTHIAATAEKLDMSARYEVAVIDECQMISDPERGYAWTRAILGVLAPEIHLCSAPEAKNLLLRIIRSCGDTVEVEEHERKTPLVCMNRVVDYASIRPGDALITFSKVGVLSVAEDLRSRGKEPAIIYGALPYSTRRKQVAGFLAGDMEYVVSTDAIGMGLNLPIRRIIFMETEKFDGHERRELRPEEIKQIAGRAGRYGMYDKGYVGATENLSLIRAGLEAVVPPLQHAVVGFSDLVITVDFDLLETLEVWNRMPTPDPYIKLDISRYITVISRIRQTGFELTKEQELRAANIPFDETDADLSSLFFKFLSRWQEEEEIERPTLKEKKTAYTLPELELYCRKLDLYFSFAKAFDCEIDREELYEEREHIAEEINMILLHNLKNNIRFCGRCGAALPLHYKGRLCTACYTRMNSGRYRKH